MHCTVCSREVTLVGGKAMGCGDRAQCPYKVFESAQIYKDLKLAPVWEGIMTLPRRGRHLDQWCANPSNGLHFLAAKKEARQPAPGAGNAFLDLVGAASATLSYYCLPTPTFGGGYWSFGFRPGELRALVVLCDDLVSDTLRAIRHPNEVTRRLVRAYFGEAESGTFDMLIEHYEDLSQALRTGKVGNRTVFFYKGAEESCGSGGRTLGYVRPEGTEAQLLGPRLATEFRCIYLTNACLTGADPEYPTVAPYLFRAATVLHELSHLACKTKDHETDAGNTAYGRASCQALAWQFMTGRHRNDPSDNADSLAYFAYDLDLITDGMLNIDKVDRGLMK